jgi:lysophospholipase L1-like esterase
VGFTVILALLWPDISTWDLLGAGFVLSAAAWAAGRGETWTPRTWAQVGAAAAATVLVAELGARLLLAPPAPVPPPQQARLVFSPEARETACLALFPEIYPDAQPQRPEGAKRVVLHLGDSMVLGTGVEPADRFTDRLDRANPETHHLNAGFPGTGPDHHLAVLRAWLHDLRPDAVVLYLYPGNDLVDLDRAYACCDHGPLLDDAFASSCPAPDWAFPPGALLARSPAPYLLRTAASHLAIAAHLNAAFSRVTSTLEPRLGDAAGTPEAEAAWSRYAGVLAAIRELAAQRGVTLTAVLLPTRVALEPGAAPSHAAAVSDRMARVVKQESIQLLDARPLFASQGRDGTYGHLFGDGVSWDEHLSSEGHAAVAGWLQDAL